MKKLILPLVFLLILCSCGSGEISPQLSGITFTAKMTYYNEEYTFDGEVDSSGVLTARMTSPEELADLVLTVNESGVTADYLGLTYSPVEGSMPFSAVLEDLYSVISYVNTGTAVANGDGVLSGRAGTIDFTLTVAPTGLPQRLEMPDERFSTVFYNISIKEDVND